MPRSISPSFLLLLLALISLLLAPAVHAFQAQAEYIYASEVSYCSSGRAVEVERFDIRYYRQNQSIGFDISARSVAEDLNADLNIQLFAYGETRINITANTCNIVAGALCPLPQYQFDGSFAYILPDSVNIDLPGLAWTVPDLEASATIILINQRTGEEALCLNAILSNGKTVYLSEVQWAIAGLTIGAFLVALLHSFWPLSPYKSGPEWRFATIVTYFQHVALCGFLSLDYPKVYKQFTLNFSWAQGLIYMAPIDAAINRMRYMTGGVNREGQTYNIISEDNGASNVISSVRSFAAASPFTTPTVQDAPSYNLISGIETTAEDIGVTYPNAFMTVFIVFLFLLCAMISIFIITAAAVLLYQLVRRRKDKKNGITSSGARSSTSFYNLRYFIWTNLLRTLLISYTPLVLFCFWQFLHRNDSGWLAVFIAALVIVWIHLAIFGVYWHISKIANNALHGGRESLSLRWTTVTKQFKRSGSGYLFILAAAAFVSSAFVAFAQGHGLIQLIPLIVIEVLVFLSFCIWRPFANRGSNILMISISIFKIAAYAILVVFYANITLNGIITAVLGFVLIAIQGVMTVILFIVTIYNLGTGILWSRRARKEAERENAEKTAVMREKGYASAQDRNTGGPLLSASIVGTGGRERTGDDYLEAGNDSGDEAHHGPPPVSSLYVPVAPNSPGSPEDRGPHSRESLQTVVPDDASGSNNRQSAASDLTLSNNYAYNASNGKKRSSTPFWKTSHREEEDEPGSNI